MDNSCFVVSVAASRSTTKISEVIVSEAFVTYIESK